MSLGKHLGCRSSLEAYLEMNNMTLNNNLGLNLYVVSTAYHIVIISDNQKLTRR